VEISASFGAGLMLLTLLVEEIQHFVGGINSAGHSVGVTVSSCEAS
jgi:hypothetical protein